MVLVFPLLLAACEGESLEQRMQANANPNHLPAKGFVGDAEQGAVFFQQSCANCHGSDALGSEQGPALIDNIYRPARHADLAYHWAVGKGVRQHHRTFGNMPALPDVTPEQAGHIIAYVRREQTRAGIKQ
jgi:mono/diheme cytochrome c family protein